MYVCRCGEMGKISGENGGPGTYRIGGEVSREGVSE